MSGKKKQWRFSVPFQTHSRKQEQLNAKVGRSGSRVSSVYLSDDSSASGFVIVPEFDYPVSTQAALEDNSHSAPNLPSGPLSPNALDGDSIDLGLISPRFSYLGQGESQEDDLAQRLAIAYEHIRSMPSVTPLRASLSSDPQLLRKQLGVPQHSVLNHPIHSSPHLPNPHPSPPEPGPPLPTSLDVSHATTPKKLGLRINTDIDVYSPSSPDQEPTQLAQRSTLGTPRNSPKSAKRRAEKTTLSASSASPASRQAQRGVFRKSNTPSSVNTFRRQISLPQMRPPSPFRVNIVSLFITRHLKRNAITSSSPFITHGTTAEPPSTQNAILT